MNIQAVSLHHPSLSENALLQRIRRASHLTQKEVAACLQVSRQTYSSYERSERAIPSLIWDRILRELPLTEDQQLWIQAARAGLSPEETDLVRSFRQLDPLRQEQILRRISYAVLRTSGTDSR